MNLEWKRSWANKYAADYRLFGGEFWANHYIGKLIWNERKTSRWEFSHGASFEIGLVDVVTAKTIAKTLVYLEG